MSSSEADAAEGSPATPGKAIDAQEHEPRLKYEALDSGSPRAQTLHSAITRLCVSDKVLAVREFREHSREVTDLSFDGGAEFLASGSADRTVAVYGLYSEEVQRLKIGQPVTTVALEPRYASRKTRELVYGTAGGALVLSSKGWLGNKETALFTGRGPLRCARMSGTLLAWTTDTGLRVYDTATHTRLGKLERPASAAADPAAPCGLLWRGDRELYVSWARHVTVVRVVGSLLPLGQPGLLPAAGRTLQVVASFDTGCTALGAAPFGADIAVLAWGPASDAPLADSLPVSSSTAGGRIILTASSTAEEQDGPADGQAAAASASPAKGDSAAGAAADSGAPPVAAADGTPPSPSDAATQQLPPPQLQQQLSLCFYSRQGQLLAADALGSSCSAAERRWHQLALSYPGDADLRLAAAAAPTPPRGSQPPVLPARSTAGSRAGSRAGSVAGSGRATPSKPRLPPSDATSPTAPSVDSTSADGAGEAAGQHAHAATDMQPQRQHEQQQDQQQQQQREQGVEGQQQQWRQQKVQQYKWWRDGEDPLYFVCTPSEIVVGRPRDGNDRVSWLAERGRFAEALVQSAVREALGEQYLQALLEAGRCEEAAGLCPRLLQHNAMSWERWAFTFAQVRGLSALAPHLPTESPQLKAATYDLVLSSFLLHPSDHEVLLQLVRRWPPDIYDVPQLQAAILSRMGGSGDWPVLQEAASHLYTVQGRHEEALKLMLQLRSQAVFDYIARHALIDRISPFAAALVDLDEVRATSLLVEHCEEVPPGEVVAALQASLWAVAADAFATADGADECQRWHRRLHHYLDWLFQKDSQLGGAFAELQVELYAEFEPARLLHFLMVSPSYPLERAYQVCEQRGLVREMVYVLGRMGSAEKALRLIIEGLRDVVQASPGPALLWLWLLARRAAVRGGVRVAVEFVQLQRDDDLWEQLIALTLGDAQLTGALLDHAGGYIDPLRVVSQIPPHLHVDNLRGRLVKIITDFRTQAGGGGGGVGSMSLQQGCNTILRHDCVVLANRLVLRSSLRRLHLKLQQGGGGSRWVLYDARTGDETAEDDAAAALLAGQGPASAAASPEPGTPPPSYAAAAAGGTPGSAQRGQQQGPPRVWVGFIGGPLPAAPEALPEQPPQQATRSPSKFVRLASSSASPVRAAGAGPRKVLAT
ncbi:hypothetical protein CHLNCDRAFT_133107 [Chlorella variabilis]|uniref:Vps41 beta-propeller domain-containing protein n=1 Tax=Chlorella variabilis TaxID=554065 RepID=E1Z2D3_CHLVA|nr:hypothetical protein CHLNCDRAFT_133107 [Chlorella variabilis]EFN59982.1 hypothetical protein CHLNCDRAFT_133107 [Chlorella variabilis]|eukprot:XP_005852084.1 hypothetical protein CHLNCDRAFT_133107 [Chlorella variabilis]